MSGTDFSLVKFCLAPSCHGAKMSGFEDYAKVCPRTQACKLVLYTIP